MKKSIRKLLALALAALVGDRAIAQSPSSLDIPAHAVPTAIQPSGIHMAIGDGHDSIPDFGVALLQCP